MRSTALQCAIVRGYAEWTTSFILQIKQVRRVMQALYHWEGRNLLMDTIVHRKRYVLNAKGERVYCAFDVRRWVMPPEDEMLCTVWQRIARHHHSELRHAGRSSQMDLKAKIIWQFVTEQIRFDHEPSGHDFWQFPPETLHLRVGDCEDKSFLCASMLLAAGISADRVRVVIGALVRNRPRPHSEGHAWPMYRNAHGVWCILESNYATLPIQMPRGDDPTPVIPKHSVPAAQSVFLSADRLAADSVSEQYVPLVCLNHQSVWTVEPLHHGVVRNAAELQPAWRKNPTFDEILRARQHR